MKSSNSNQNQGEGDRVSARKYNKAASEFASSGKVESAAKDAREFVDEEPVAAAAAESAAKHGPSSTKVSIDELVAKGRSVVDRVRNYVNSKISK